MTANGEEGGFDAGAALDDAVERFVALASLMAAAVSASGGAAPVTVTAVNGEELDAAAPLPSGHSGRDELVAGFEELVASATTLRSPQVGAGERAEVVERMVVVRNRLSRSAGDALGGRDYQPVGPVPTDGFLGLGRLLGLMSALVATGRGEFPCFVRLHADAVGEVLGARDEGRFGAGGRYVAQRRNDRGSIRVLDEDGRAMWVAAGHPYELVR